MKPVTRAPDEQPRAGPRKGCFGMGLAFNIPIDSRTEPPPGRVPRDVQIHDMPMIPACGNPPGEFVSCCARYRTQSQRITKTCVHGPDLSPGVSQMVGRRAGCSWFD